MNNEIKVLMNKLIEKFGGSFKRINNRTFWETPEGEHYHVTTVFLRRMAAKPAPKKEIHEPISSQEVLVNGRTESVEPERRSEEVAQITEKIEEEGIPSETPKKKKKDRKKKTKPKVENEEEPREEAVEEPSDDPIPPILNEDEQEQL